MGIARRGRRGRRILAVVLIAASAASAASALAACSDDKDFTATHEGGDDPARNPDGMHPVSTDFRGGKKETQVKVTWQRSLDEAARRERRLVVFVMFFRHGDKRPTSMVMADVGSGQSVRCGEIQLKDSAPWVFASSGPFIDCPDLPEARVEATATSATVRWPNGAVHMPGNMEWVVRLVSHPPGLEPMEEFLPTQVEPVTEWPKQRAVTRSAQMQD